MLSVGLVGLPNAGKSTLFNLLTKRSVPAENFPFCTIDPHDGIVEVEDKRLEELSKITNSNKIVPAAIEFRDIAGLVKNASSGAGLGNQFLSHIREVDMILMVIRTFVNDKIIHVENRVNPQDDYDILMLELTIADTKSLENQTNRLMKDKLRDKHCDQKLELLAQIQAKLAEIKPAIEVINKENYDKEVIAWRKSLNLLTDKVIMKLANISTDGVNIDFAADTKLDIGLESDLDGSSPEERMEFGLEAQSGINKLIKSAFTKLNLETYLTTGEVETRAWTYTKGSTAPVCAGKIHTDFEKKFIKGEIIKFEDFVQLQGRKNSIEKGRMQVVGKDYIMQDGDVVEFKIG